MSLIELEFPVFVIALIANIALILVVLRYAPRNKSRLMFVLFVLSQTTWIVVNYFAVRSNADSILSMAKWTIVAAIPHPVLFFLFIKSFLSKSEQINRNHVLTFCALVIAFIFLARSPFLFTNLEIINGVPTPVAGWGMMLFGIYISVFVIASFIHIYKSWHTSEGIERHQWRLIGVGLLLTFFLVLIFNFILPVIGGETLYVNFGHIYTLPFVIFTAYAMIRYKLLNIKSILAELAVIILSLILVVQLVSANSIGQFMVSLFVLVGTIIVGILLVRGVLKEVEQREELAKLNIDLKALIKQRESLMHLINHKVKGSFTHSKYIFAGILDGTFGEVSEDVRKRAQQGLDSDNGGIATVDLILNASNLQSGTIKYDMQKLDLKNILTEVIEDKKPIAEKKGLQFIVNLQDGNYQVRGDSTWLKEAINNLVENSIRYTKNGKININLEKRGGNKILIIIKDTGVGITKEDKKNLFTEGGRGKESVKINTDSTGYGLYSVKLIVEAHKGRVWAESEGPDKGSTFYMEIDSLN